ncbi:response regulator transcription factor [Parapedobacter sp. 2B3]|uniref:response regulator transcription factor n=1 Tax=Parapedobacter sp. 2B3 TaxID=3342381 RepID=UPI0035B67A2F
MIDVLLVEDEVKLAHVLMVSLETKAFCVTYAATATEALESFNQTKPDIVVMDVMMPGMDGFTLAAKIRETDASTPMIFITSRTATEDVLHGFKVGGNDYVKKPFIIDELVARITSLVGLKKRINTMGHIHIGRYTLNPERQVLRYEHEALQLSYRQSVLLKMLYEHRNTVLLRDEILKEFWSSGQATTGRSLDVFVCRLRKHLSKDPNIQITTVRGIGYKMMV